ncbi:sensor histidine kinase [Acuticoccus sp. MNP-M23]|uniref:sensor histidine kinase n=1 Tax=Acuticoccus sp. MNP-M23 TaxID=3072793 RepID=UPI0028167DE2|nr:sensor histidine kinase [Acuticoccus sp. MNP-M23]WMS41852.1 sensor histidine kinase [Acuticoccus sp. MNP-M23]
MTVDQGDLVRSERLVVLAPFARDASVLEQILLERSIDVARRASLDCQLRSAHRLEVGAFLLTAEAMTPATLDALIDLLTREPLWSAPPVVLLGESEIQAERWARRLLDARDGQPITVLIRPSSILEIATAVQSALVARRRQYDLADLIEKHSRAETHANVLFEELSHRVKNVFSMVSSLGILTEAAAGNSAEFRTAFRARMNALSRAYDALREGNWQAAPLKLVIEATAGGLLTPDERGVLTLEGPDISLASDQATGLGLVMHELASNARKYGALSTPQGRVAVTWSHDAGGKVMLLWAEMGGPQVIAPEREGFGTTVIKSAMPNGETELSYEPTGVRCRLSFKLQK